MSIDNSILRKKGPDLSLLKAELLLDGVVADSRARRHLLDKGWQAGFIHGGVLEFDSIGVVNTRSLDILSAQEDSVRLCLTMDDQLYIEWQNHAFTCKALPQGTGLVGNEEVFTGHEMFSLHSPNVVFCAPVEQCIYGVIDEACQFCTFKMNGPIKKLPKEHFGRALDRLKSNYELLDSVAIGGGTPSLVDGGARYYSELVEECSQRSLSSSVEMVPPPEMKHFSHLWASGLSSLIMSLEIWDDNIRQSICLGKGKIERSHYFKSWEFAVNALGPGRVASVLLVGLEPVESSLRGALSLISMGVIPTMIPFRSYDSMAGSPGYEIVTPSQLLDLEREVSSALAAVGLSSSMQPGCTACGGCSLESMLTLHRDNDVSVEQAIQ